MRVYIPSQPWGLLYDGEFTTPRFAVGQDATLETPEGVAATVYTTETGSTTTTLTTDSFGRLVGWVEEGSYDLTVGGVTERVEAVGGRPAGVIRVGRTTEALDATSLAALDNDGVFELGGGNYYSSSPLDFAGSRSIELRGQGGCSTGGAGTNLIYTGSAARFIDARSANGFKMRGIRTLYSSPSFTGKLLDLSASTGDTALTQVEDCSFGGVDATAVNAAALVSLHKAIDVTIRDSLFGRCVCAVKGSDDSSGYSNVIKLRDCYFNATGGVGSSLAPIQNAGQAWTVDGCTFEPLASGNAGAYAQTGTAVAPVGLVFRGCWFGDANTSGTWISVGAGGAAIEVSGGCYFQGGAKAIAIGNNTVGVTVTGNSFRGATGSALPDGVTVGPGCSCIIVEGNYFQPSGATVVTTPITFSDNAPSSRSQFVSGDATVATTWLPGKLHVDNYLALKEIADPGGATTDRVRIFAIVDGGGKTDLDARFQTGAAIKVVEEA